LWVLGSLGIKNYRDCPFGLFAVDVERELVTYPAALLGASIIYIYCSIVDYQMLGNTMVPLLRTVTIPPNRNRGEMIHEKFENPLYVKVRLKRVEDIEISFHDDTGKLIAFQAGSALLAIEFRKVNSYG
jgi:hypothetical protein